jgi:transposase
MRVYLDESGIEQFMFRPYAWGTRGQRIFADIPGSYSMRTTVIAAKCADRLIAPFVFEGYTNGDIFCDWIENILLPELNPGQVVIIDNASIHQSPRISELIESVGCSLMYLPTYSPDFNPIENVWSQIKHHVCSYKPIDDPLDPFLDQLLIRLGTGLSILNRN